MATIVRNDKIPDNFRISGLAAAMDSPTDKANRRMYSSAAAAAKRREKAAADAIYRRDVGLDAITPSVKGRQGITPSTMGIAAQARFAQLAKVAKMAGDFVSTINKIRDSEEAAANPEFAALANDPKLMAVIRRVVEKIGKEVDAITKDSLSAARNEVAGSEEERDEINKRIAKEEGLAGVDSGLNKFTSDYALRIEAARKRAREVGAALNPARVAAGLPDTVATADDLFALGREGASKFSPRG